MLVPGGLPPVGGGCLPPRGSYSTETKSMEPEKMSVFFVIALTSFAIISIEG